MKTYPVYLVGLDRARCVVVGGGSVAERKVRALLDADARVTVVAPDLCPTLEQLAGAGRIRVLERAYQTGDLEGAFLVIAATDDPDTNDRVWRDGVAAGLLVNVVDDPERCNFIAPSVVRRGALSLAISTSGRCPALSRHLRKQLEREFPAAYGDYLVLLGDLRERAVESLTLPERRAFWQDIFSSNVLRLVLEGDDREARRRAEAILKRRLSRVH